MIKNGNCGAFNPELLECLDERDCLELCGVSELTNNVPLKDVLHKAEKIKQPESKRDSTEKIEIDR